MFGVGPVDEVGQQIEDVFLLHGGEQGGRHHETVDGSMEVMSSSFTFVTVLGFIMSVFIQYSLFLIFMIRPFSLVPSLSEKTLAPYWSLISLPGSTIDSKRS